MNSQSQANIVNQPIHATKSQALPIQIENTDPIQHLCNQLNNTTSLSDLPLCLLAEPSCAHNEGNFGESALAQHFAVAEG
jgi:hypothetical protein